MNSDHSRVITKTYCERVSLLLWVFPRYVFEEEKRRASLGICFLFFLTGVLQSAKPGAHTSRMLKKCVHLRYLLLLPSGSWWEGLIVKCWIIIEGNTTLGHLLWTNLQLGPVTYELKLNSILAWDFVHFCGTCVLVLCFSFFYFSSNIPQSLGKKSILILLILLLIILLLILLLLFQPYHRRVGSAVQDLNSVFLSVLFRHNT